MLYCDCRGDKVVKMLGCYRLLGFAACSKLDSSHGLPHSITSCTLQIKYLKQCKYNYVVRFWDKKLVHFNKNQ